MKNQIMELEVVIEPTKATQYGIKACVSEDSSEETKIYYDTSDQKLKFDTSNSSKEGFGRKIIEEAPLKLNKNEPLILKIFIDKSIIEVFANDKQAIARMVYPTMGGMNVKLFSDGGDIRAKKITLWKLMASNPY